MLEIINKWGADYLVTDTPIHPLPQPITSVHHITLQPGQWITRIGRIRRTSFMLIPGHRMQYQGLLELQGHTYAIFHNPAHDKPQMSLFGEGRQYRYAMTCVFTDGLLSCFLIGRGGPHGMRDLQLDFLE